MMRMTDSWIAESPSWLVGTVLLALMITANFLGRWFRTRRATSPGEDDSTQESYILSAVFGLLALLLGFTFALAVDRFEARRLLVLDEANAIRTTYQRAQTFEEPHRTRLAGLIRQYAGNRLALAQATDMGERARLMSASQGLQAAMWSATVAAVAPSRDDVSAAFMDSMNQVMEVGAARKEARQAHVPRRIFTVLLIYMVVATASLGYTIDRRYRVEMILLLALSAMSYLLIVDIDEASQGGVRESQQPMLDLKALAESSPPPPPAQREAR